MDNRLFHIIWRNQKASGAVMNYFLNLSGVDKRTIPKHHKTENFHNYLKLNNIPIYKTTGIQKQTKQLPRRVYL